MALDFDREIARLFHDLAPRSGAPAADIFEEEGRRVLADSSEPGLVQEVLLARREGPDELRLYRADPTRRRFDPIPWPKELESVRARLLRNLELGAEQGPAENRRAFLGTSPWIAPEALALIIPRRRLEAP